MKKIIISMLLISLLIISGCKEPVVIDDSQATAEGVKQVVDANNEFAFDLYKELDQEGKNVFFSPYSISTAVAMTYEGAKGDTAKEIADVFHFPEKSILRMNTAKIYNEINKKDKAYKLHTANALWAEKTYPFLADYLSTIERYYGGKTTNLDFINQAEASRKIINDWVEDQTNDKIKDLIPAGVLNPLTRLVLTNAIYFKGRWEWEFDKSDTREQDFRITPENTVKVQMMYMDPDKARFNYASLEKLQILELPYKGEEISMLILLPKQGKEFNYETGERITYDYTLEDIELSKLDEYKSKMQETKMDAIYLPKFKFETKYLMADTLAEMGMPTAFKTDGSADFSGMDGTRDLFISSVIHQAFVEVNEEGTEAAAATAIVVGITAVMPTNIFRADHPFIFLIQEKGTGNILFMGKVVNPTAN
ncbi:serpin family protein [Candidatus Woesearchaeota archaeon]|nr:serpin family protein [Candidatus Woesearchaeota archaeon]